MKAIIRYRGYIALSLVWLLLFGLYVAYERWPRPEPIAIVEATVAPSATPAPLQVHVAGAVQRPGVYAVPPGSRLVTAVEYAGGMKAEAAEESVNLAEPLRDGQQVYVPQRGTPAPPSPTPFSQPASAGSASVAPVGGKVNINTAGGQELESLPGIGPALAERILAYREANGPFSGPEQLMEVKGIGEATFEKLRPYVTTQ